MQRLDLLTISGRLDPVAAAKLQEEINKLFDTGHWRILLDLGQLEYISSPALRVLVSARKRAREHRIGGSERGDVRIVNLQERVRKVFDLVGFTGLFDIYDNMVDAVASF
jgi:anti-sigma B factor antagonist